MITKLKVGKSTFAAAAPKNLILSFEKGLNAIAGVTAVDITRWSELKTVISQLRRDEAKEMYDTITFDTISIAYDLCEEYICARHNVDSISDIAWGRGYAETKEEFAKTLRQITMMGYGLILISHSEKRVEKSEAKGEVEYISPALNKRAYDIVNQLVDVIGYIDITFKEDGSSERWLYTRRTPTVMAGSRFPHLANKIPFGYQELTEAIANAIEESGRQGAELVESHFSEEDEEKKDRPFEEVQEEARKVWGELIERGTDVIDKAKDIITEIFGRPVRLSSITPKQQDLFELVLREIKKL